MLIISPCRAKEVNYDWAQYALHPSGTGPYKFDRFVPHERLELVPNAQYWDKDRIPKQDRLVLIPVPEASTRTTALFILGEFDTTKRLALLTKLNEAMNEESARRA